ncbi:MAG: NAD(P)/FAD-dependent oxidoreductase [Synechococcus sp.]|nr:NAD(P)/FAD-dependent oxidoreductase [Synechococcus sp.]
MKRRHFLHLSQLIVLSYLLSTSCQHNNVRTNNDQVPSVLIIGAGLAGLAAAKRLANEGYAVQVLEGRDRLGGRTWTSNVWADAPVDLGASWIHGVEGNPLTALAEDIETPLVATRYDRAITYGITGKPLTETEKRTLENLQEKIDEAIAIGQDAETDQSLEKLLNRALDQVNQPQAIQQLIDFLLNSTIEQEYSGSLAELSTYWFDDGESYDGEDALFEEGYQAIVNYLAQDIPIELNQIVETINWSGDRPTVKTNQDTYSTDHVIITLPLGVLKAGQVEFSPTLPDAKQKAIAALGVGVLNKCYLRFEKVFWPEDMDWLEQVAEETGFWTEWVNLAGVTDLPILLGFNAATQGREMETWTDEAIVTSAMATLRHLFGEEIPEPIDYQITRWAADPFARGSYSFNAVGSTPDMRDRLAEPLEDQLFFAGEATERQYFGTAHGAYLSGLRVAEEILTL